MLDNFELLQQVYALLADLTSTYPEFEKWFWEKVVVEMFGNKRAILLKYDNAIVAAVAILKTVPGEEKICTFRLARKYRKNGIGKMFFQECMEYLNARHVGITISEEHHSEFHSIIKRFDLCLEQVVEFYPRTGYCSKEFVYNTNIIPPASPECNP